MNNKRALEKERQDVLKAMADIRSMQPGALSEQMLRVRHKGKARPVLRGPYYVLSRWQNGKNCSRRVKKKDLAQVKADVANYERFMALSERFVTLTRRLGEVERSEDAAVRELKKGLKSRSSGAGKSRG